MMNAVSQTTINRFSTSNLCPICGGHEKLPRGQGIRCSGYSLPDGNVCCTREEYSNASTMIKYLPASNGWLHRQNGIQTQRKPISTNASKPKTKIHETYDYTDETGSLIYQVCRMNYIDENGQPIIDPETGKIKKTFRQRQPDGNEGWEWNLKGVDKVLYKLPQLIKANKGEFVFIVEGEKCVNSLLSMGLSATCNAGGSGKWFERFNQYLKNHRVIILPDNDEPGRDHAEKVASSLEGTAASLKILELPNLPPKGDIIEWVNAGGAAEKLRKLADDCKQWESEKIKPSKSICFADIQTEEIHWLWPGRIALKKISMIAGNPGLGKSFLTVDMAARVSTGAEWSDRSKGCKGSVLLLNAEDDSADTIKPRLIAAGADCSLIHSIPFSSVSSLTDDIKKIEEAIRELKDCKLLVIDPITAYLGNVDSYKNSAVRQLLATITDLAQKHKIAVVLVSHLNKSNSQQNAVNRISGSLGFVAAARSAWLVGCDPTNSEARLFVPIKNNIGNDKTGLRFEIRGEKQPSLHWDDDVIFTTADELQSQSYDKTEPSPIDTAKEWLHHILSKGPIGAIEIKEMIENTKFSQRTIERAKKELGIKSKKSGYDGIWLWELPEDNPKTANCLQDRQDSHVTELATLGTLGTLGDSELPYQGVFREH